MRNTKAEERPATTPAQFALFVAERREQAVRIAYRLIGSDGAAAEDVAQEAFVRAYQGLASFRGEASLDTWFYRILVREAQRFRRWRRLRQLWTPTTDVLPDPPIETPEADPALRRRVARAFDRLSPGQRDAVVLVHLEEFTVVEAAAMLGKAVGTVKSHLHRGLQALRRELVDLHEPASGAFHDPETGRKPEESEP